MTQWRVTAGLASVVLVLGGSQNAAAQSAVAPPGFALDRFEPAARGSEWFAGDSLDLRGAMRWTAGVTSDLTSRPLRLFTDSHVQVGPLIRTMWIVHAGGNVVLFDRLRVNLNVPVLLLEHGEDTTLPPARYIGPSGASLGDPRIDLDVRVFGTYGDAFTAAAGIALHLPFGSTSHYMSDGSLRVTPRFLGAGEIGRFTYAAQLGAMVHTAGSAYFDGRNVGGVDVVWSLGAGVHFLDHALLVGVELWGRGYVTGASAFEKHESLAPYEGDFGAHYLIGGRVRVGADVGAAGLGNAPEGYGAPAYRVLTSVDYLAP